MPDTNYLLYLFAALAFGYALGSIPFGVVLTRLAGMGDIRTIGSGNIGATNVLRTGSKVLAAATLVGDLLKGTVAVVAADRLLGLFWPAAAAFAGIWLAVAALTRYSSLSALVASVVSPFILYGFGLPASAVLVAVLAALLWIKHAENIQRLFAGTEGRIGEKSGG